jgi:hypothetical protein
LFFTIAPPADLLKVEELLALHCNEFRSVSITVNKENATRHEYSVSLKKEVSKDQLLQAMTAVEGLRQIKITNHELTAAN